MIAIVTLAVLLLIVLSGLRIANQYERAVVFRLGRYRGIAGPGLYWLIPMIERASKVDLRVMTDRLEEQETITKDNVPIKVNAVIWYRVVDPKSARLEVRDVAVAVIQVALTTLRIVLGQHTLDDVLKEQEAISRIMQSKIDAVTEPWGVKVERVEMKNVEIPPTMQRAVRLLRRASRHEPAERRRRTQRSRAPDACGCGGKRSICGVDSALE